MLSDYEMLINSAIEVGPAARIQRVVDLGRMRVRIRGVAATTRTFEIGKKIIFILLLF